MSKVSEKLKLSLGKKLFIGTVLACVGIALVFTSISIYFDFKKQVYSLQGSLENPTSKVIREEMVKKGTFEAIAYRGLAYFAAHGLKTLFVGILLLLMVQVLITRHLNEISKFVKSHNQGKGKGWKDLELDRSTQEEDELSRLVQAINEMGLLVDRDRSKSESKITEMTQELERQNAASIELSRLSSLGEMVAGIAHEIKNPLHLLNANVHMLKKALQKENIKSEKISRRIDSFEKTLWRVDAIVKSLLNYARQGKTDPFEAIGPEELFETTLGICEEMARSKGIPITVSIDVFDRNQTQIVGQPIGLSQVLINLVKNSMDEIEKIEERWIELSLKEEEEHFLVTCRDSGNGIPKEVADRMFESFFTTKPTGKGTGLGLGICKRIVNLHGGSIWVDHQDTHTKITFSLIKRELPADQVDETVNEPKAS